MCPKMRRLFDIIDRVATDCDNVGVMFSGGRDSIVMLDLFMTRARKTVSRIFFLRVCPNLEFQEKVTRYYEARYKITIDRLIHPKAWAYFGPAYQGRKQRWSDAEKRIRADFEVGWLSYGYRKDESLQKRGQIATTDAGIDRKYRKVFPLADWSRKHCQAYIEKKKLPLPTEYRNGWSDISVFKGETLLYIARSYPNDYRTLIATYPDLEGEFIRAEEAERNGKFRRE